MLLWAGVGYIWWEFALWVSVSSHGSHGHSTSLVSPPAHTRAGHHHCSPAAGEAATHGSSGELLTLLWGDCFLSHLFRLSPLTQDSLARASGQAARQSDPESIQVWLNTWLQWVLLPSGCIHQVSNPKRDTSGIHVPPSKSAACGCFHAHTRAFLFAVQHKEWNPSWEHFSEGHPTWQIRQQRAANTGRDLDLGGGLSRSAPEKEVN